MWNDVDEWSASRWCFIASGSSWFLIILGVLVSHGRENHVHRNLNKAVHSYDYKKGPGLHESDVSCDAATDITQQPYIFSKICSKTQFFRVELTLFASLRSQIMTFSHPCQRLHLFWSTLFQQLIFITMNSLSNFPTYQLRVWDLRTLVVWIFYWIEKTWIKPALEK